MSGRMMVSFSSRMFEKVADMAPVPPGVAMVVWGIVRELFVIKGVMVCKKSGFPTKLLA